MIFSADFANQLTVLEEQMFCRTDCWVPLSDALGAPE